MSRKSRRHAKQLKAAVALIWFLLLVAMFYGLSQIQAPMKEWPKLLQAYFEGLGPAGPLVFIAIFTARTLTLLPTWILSIPAGVVWGPWLALVYSLLGEFASGAFGFWLGHTLGREWFADTNVSLLRKVENHLKAHGFVTTVVLRLIFTPFDPVNIACGMTGMRFKDYMLGTVIGVIPGMISLVFIGGAWWEPKNLIVAAAGLLLSFGLAKWVGRTKEGSKIMHELGRK